MTLKLLIFGCLVAAALITADRYGGRHDGFGGHGGHGPQGSHGGGFGGHGHPSPHGHSRGPPHGPPPHGHGNYPQGHGHGGHGGFHHCSDCHQGHEHRPPPPPHDHDHGHTPQPTQPPKPTKPQQPKQPQIPEIEVNFMIYEPDGMQAWIVQQTNVVFFGIELYVNVEPTKAGAKCDVCANTTVITNGKLIIENLDVVVKKGDVLYYFALIGNGHSVVRQKLQILQVTEFHIGKCNCLGTSEIEDIDIRFNENSPRIGRAAQINIDAPGAEAANDIFGTTERPARPRLEYIEFDPEQNSNPEYLTALRSMHFRRGETVGEALDALYGTTTTTVRPVNVEEINLQREVHIMEHIVEFMRSNSKCADKMTNKLVLLKQPPPSVTGEIGLEKFLKSYFLVSLELEKLGRAIREAVSVNALEGRGIEFEMDSYVDKQRVLFYTREKVLEDIVDPDFDEVITVV